MVDALAAGFLRPGNDNDIYDWVTAIFGDPWGPHDDAALIPAEYAEQVHILIYDISDDGRGDLVDGSLLASTTTYEDRA